MSCLAESRPSGRPVLSSCRVVACHVTPHVCLKHVMDCNVKPSLAGGFHSPLGAPQGEITKGTFVKGHLCAYPSFVVHGRRMSHDIRHVMKDN